MKQIVWALPLLALALGCQEPTGTSADTPQKASAPSLATVSDSLWQASTDVNGLDKTVRTVIETAHAYKWDAALVIRCSPRKIEAYIVVPVSFR
ncbi:MAG TPA: hypothetical protein VF126_10530 [Acidobacteriaceae bacterium]